MNSEAYASLSEFKTVRLNAAESGFFQPPRSDIAREMIITVHEGKRVLVYPHHPKGFTYLEIDKDASFAGILWPTPAIEVDPSTRYDARILHEGLGDLLISGSHVMITARNDRGIFDDAIRVTLWGGNADEGTPGHEVKTIIGFKTWRFVSGPDRRVLFERKIAE